MTIPREIVKVSATDSSGLESAAAARELVVRYPANDGPQKLRGMTNPREK